MSCDQRSCSNSGEAMPLGFSPNAQPARSKKASGATSTGFGYPENSKFPSKMDNLLSLMEDLSGTCQF